MPKKPSTRLAGKRREIKFRQTNQRAKKMFNTCEGIARDMSEELGLKILPVISDDFYSARFIAGQLENAPGITVGRRRMETTEHRALIVQLCREFNQVHRRRPAS